MLKLLFGKVILMALAIPWNLFYLKVVVHFMLQ